MEQFRMWSGPKGSSMQDRLDRSAEAKKTLLERFKKQPGPGDKEYEERQAQLKEVAEARRQREGERGGQRAAEEAGRAEARRRGRRNGERRGPAEEPPRAEPARLKALEDAELHRKQAEEEARKAAE